MKDNYHVFIFALLMAAASHSYGEIIFDGGAAPETEGWNEYVRLDPLTSRSYQDGIFRSEASVGADRSDYRRSISHQESSLDLNWRARNFDDNSASYLQILIRGSQVYSEILASWQSDIASLIMRPDTSVPGEPDEFVITPGEFHVFDLEANVATYTFLIDGNPLKTMDLQDPDGTILQIQFGFTPFMGIGGTAEWDYIQAEGIPEPMTVTLFVTGLLLIPLGRSAKRMI